MSTINSFKKVALVATTLIAAPSAFAGVAEQADLCNQIRYAFVLNKANVNSLVALSCSALSHNANEGKGMKFEESMTTFHQWSTTGDAATGIKVEGFCAVPMPDLKDGNLAPHKISMVFTKDKKAPQGHTAINAKGVIDGKPMALHFSPPNNGFLDDRCGPDEIIVNRLESIELGSATQMAMDPIMSLIHSRHSGMSLHLLGRENWTQGNGSTSFSGLGVVYRTAQWISDRQLAISATTNGTGTLNIRSANYLYYADDEPMTGDGSSDNRFQSSKYYGGSGGYFEFRRDSFGQAVGYANTDLPSNSKFQAWPIAGGAQVAGCTSLVYTSELDLPTDAKLNTCERVMEKSALYKYAKVQYGHIVDTDQTQVKVQDPVTVLKQKVERYLESHYPPAQFYSNGPHDHEQSAADWTAEDVARGYVVTDRNFTIKGDTVEVVEQRKKLGGKEYMEKFSIPMSVINN